MYNIRDKHIKINNSSELVLFITIMENNNEIISDNYILLCRKTQFIYPLFFMFDIENRYWDFPSSPSQFYDLNLQNIKYYFRKKKLKKIIYGKK